MQTAVVFHFELITSSPYNHVNFSITISTTSFKFKVLAAAIQKSSSSDSPHAEQTARISHLNLLFTNLYPSYLLPVLLFYRYTPCWQTIMHK